MIFVRKNGQGAALKRLPPRSVFLFALSENADNVSTLHRRICGASASRRARLPWRGLSSLS